MRSLFAPTKVEKFPEPLIGEVEQKIAHGVSGRVKCLGTSWPARFYQSDCQATVVPSESVNIIAIQGITMLVVPAYSTGQ